MAESFFSRPGIDVFVPSGVPLGEALRGVTHLGVGAHADDLEFMAFPAIAECHRGAGRFAGVVVTDGAGSVRLDGTGVEERRNQRRQEQREAAVIGGYAAVVQLGLSSAELKGPFSPLVAGDLAEIFQLATPRVVYTHNPADRHDSHVAVSLAVIRALRAVAPGRRPAQVLGCEVWRDLDWLTGPDRVRLDCGPDESLAAALNSVFRSQIEGGKRYDLAVLGRRRAHATFDESHAADAAEMLALAMDLTPLINNATLPVEDYVLAKIDRFRADVASRLQGA
ncbi:MAG: PIG-L deacetylase family protein [Chthoniobacterales bacterium]